MSGSAVGIALAGGLSVLLHVLWQHARIRGVLLEAYQYLLLRPAPTAFKEPTVLQTLAQVQTSEPGEVGRGKACLLPHSSGRHQAYTISSAFVLGKRVFDPMSQTRAVMVLIQISRRVVT